MEAFSVLNATRRQRNQLRNSLDQQISEMRRDTTSANARTLFALLEQARISNDQLLEDINSRLFESGRLLADKAILIGLDADTLNESQKTTLIEDPTDNLILHCILAHARSYSSEFKILLSGNREDFDSQPVRIARANVGLDSVFSKAEQFLSWLRSRSPS